MPFRSNQFYAIFVAESYFHMDQEGSEEIILFHLIVLRLGKPILSVGDVRRP